ncbi:MAG: DUF3134 family protein [Thermostichales cyanobacterium DRC_bins_46]
MTFVNRSLQEFPRQQRATVIPSQDSLSILDWLRKEGRLIDRPAEIQSSLPTDDEIDDELGDLIDDDDYDDDFGDEEE